MRDKKTVKAILLEEIGKTEGCTFAEVIDFLDKIGIRARGDRTVWLENYNIVFWYNVSAIISDLIIEMVMNGELFLVPVDVSEYTKVGDEVPLPRVKNLFPQPSGGYKKPHWMPVCIRTTPVLVEKYKGVK